MNVIARRSYDITSSSQEPFRMAHLGILKSVSPAIGRVGLMTSGEIETDLAAFTADLNRPGMLITCPPVYQIAARKPLV